MTKPHLIITMGDPAGIGPEIIQKAGMLFSGEGAGPALKDCRITVYGDAKLLGDIPFEVKDFNLAPNDLVLGQVDARCGHAAFTYLTAAIDACMAGEADAIVTAPLHKEAMNLAGHAYPGHTEILAEKSGVDDFVMMLAWPKLTVSHVTTHVPVRKAVDMISVDTIERVTRITYKALSRLKGEPASLAVGGLNPHAGENGLLGHEELEIIGPAVQKMQNDGLNVTGPLPPDTAFHRAYHGEFDGVIAMLHDHGHVAGKLIDFDQGVNCTLGLPFVRTSVGHGTAFDIAGTDQANPQSLISALEMALGLL